MIDDHRAFVGPKVNFDVIGATQFSVLLWAGLRERNNLLDVGCGSLRGGRFCMMYLNPDKYFGVEPEEELVKAGIELEIGNDLVKLKKPIFKYNKDFDFSGFPQFNFILVHSIFIHAELEQIKTCLRRCKERLMDDGKILFTFLPGPEDSPKGEWEYPNTVRYKANTIEKIVSDLGLSFEFLQVPNHPHQWVLSKRLDNS